MDKQKSIPLCGCFCVCDILLVKFSWAMAGNRLVLIEQNAILNLSSSTDYKYVAWTTVDGAHSLYDKYGYTRNINKYF